MSRLMLDTSAYSAFMRQRPAIVAALQTASEIHMSPIVLGELHAGFERGRHRDENERGLSNFLSSPRVTVAVINDETALAYAAIRNFLRTAGQPIPANDMWIAAGAMQHGLRLLTTDAHYKRLPQIVVEHCSI